MKTIIISRRAQPTDKPDQFHRHPFAQLLPRVKMVLRDRLAISSKTLTSMAESSAASARVSILRARTRVASEEANLRANRALEMASRAQNT